MYSLEEPVKWQEENEPRLAKQYLLFSIVVHLSQGVPMSAVYHRFESAFAISSCFLLSPFITKSQQDKTAAQTTRAEIWKSEIWKPKSTKKRDDSVQNGRKLHVRATAPQKGTGDIS